MRWIGILGLALCLQVPVVVAQDEPAWTSSASFLKDMEQSASAPWGARSQMGQEDVWSAVCCPGGRASGPGDGLGGCFSRNPAAVCRNDLGIPPRRGRVASTSRQRDLGGVAQACDVFRIVHQAPSTRQSLHGQFPQGLLNQGKLHSANTGTWLVRGGFVTFGVDERERPRITCDSSTVVCLAKGDSARLHQVRGRYDVLDNELHVETGRLDWERTVREGDFQAEVRAFDIRLKGSTFTTDSATFQSDMFGTPLHGRSTSRFRQKSRPKSAPIPGLNPAPVGSCWTACFMACRTRVAWRYVGPR